MRRFCQSLLSVSVFAMMPVIAGAAGTYYNGNTYQNSQRYGSSAGGYYNTYGAGRGYGQTQTMTTTRVTKKSATQQKSASASVKKGFQLSAMLGHEFANWDIEMDKAGSKLRYDGLAWNVVSADGVYYFDTSTPMQINFGARYGVQSGETSMTDDDISRGGYGSQSYTEGIVTGYAMSIGTSKDGVQQGFNVGFGLTDFFTVGRMKVTPSVGYRYFKHKLVTKDNSGLTMDVFNGNSSHPYVNCIELNGETQCDPFVLFEFISSSGTSLGTSVTGREEDVLGSLSNILFKGIPDGSDSVSVNLGDTYYYRQAGTSHEYSTEWYGPYLALDIDYAINATNNFTAGIEFGLPMYDSKGNQPYRVDWAHPTSVEDKGGFGDSYHLGLNATWSTAITNSVVFSLGMTYDYYNAKKADATTFINQDYYKSMVTNLEAAIDYLTTSGGSATTIAAYQASLTQAQDIVNYYNGTGWKIESKDEIKSVYSAMGIRMGLSVKF